jgi:hypothetical protein
MVLTVAEFNTEFSKNIKEMFDNQSREAMKNAAYSLVYDVSDTSEYTASYTSTEGGDLPAYFDEGEPLKNSSIGKGYKVTYDSAEFGHKMAITKKARLKVGDNTESIAKIADKQKNTLILQMKNFIELETRALLDYANGSNAAYKILAPDLKPLYSGTHTWKSTGTTFDNDLGTDAIDLAHAADIKTYAGAFTDSHGIPMPLNFDRIFVKLGGAASKQAKAIYASTTAQGQYQVTDLGNINIYAGDVKVIEVPRMSSGNDYFYMADTSMLNVDNPLFVEFVQRPMAEGTFKENDNLTWEMPASCSFKFGIKNLPFNIIGGKVA